MKTNKFINQLKSLLNTKFLNFRGEGDNMQVELGSNGHKYKEELIKQWKIARVEKNLETILIREDVQSTDLKTETESSTNDTLQGGLWKSTLLGKDYLQKYAQKYRELRESVITCNPILTVKSCISMSESKLHTFLTWNQKAKETLLIADHFLGTEECLERFYSLQRKRKIWWMRYSANPSRYNLEVSLQNQEVKEGDENLELNNIQQQQMVILKANFNNDSSIEMEQMMILPRKPTSLKDEPCVIRSIIPLEKATCGT